MRIASTLAALAIGIGIAAPAAADASAATPPGVTYGATVGVSEYVGTPWAHHYGVYPNVGAYASFPTSFGSVTPAVGAEYTPEFDGLWGPSAMVSADFAQSDAWGLDVIAMWWVDQPRTAAFLEDGATAYYAGLGGGASWFFGNLTLSASANAHRGINDVAADWIVFPSAQASYTLLGL